MGLRSSYAASAKPNRGDTSFVSMLIGATHLLQPVQYRNILWVFLIEDSISSGHADSDIRLSQYCYRSAGLLLSANGRLAVAPRLRHPTPFPLVSMQAVLSPGAGLGLFDEGVHQRVEEGRGFGGQNDAARELAVAQRVLRRGLLAGFRDRAGGAFGVGAVGLDLTFGCHSFVWRTGPLWGDDMGFRSR